MSRKRASPPAPEPLVTPRRGAAGSRRRERNEALELVTRLMSIPGQSGEESQVSDFIVRQLRAAGASAKCIRRDTAHEQTPINGQTGNLILKLPGTFRAPRRLLMAHMDTVPICVGSRPERKGSLIRSADPQTGLGADDRAGVAVTLHTAMQILRHRVPHPPLTFLWTVQEEIGLHGARQVRLGLLGRPRRAFNWDGGAAHKLTIGATGGYRLTIEIRGLASHAGNTPEEGISAIAIAALAIADLQRQGWHGAVRKQRKTGTSNIGVIQGGAATNVVTDRVLLRAEARSHDAEFRRRIVQRMERAFDEAVDRVRNVDGKCGQVTFQGHLDYEAFRLDQDHPSVCAAAHAVRRVGAEPEYAITNGGLDANWMTARGIPTVSLGCGQVNQHQVKEALEVRAFHKACQIAWMLATPDPDEARDY